MKAKYYIETWDIERQEWSPQDGVRTGPYTLFGLRKAIRKLRTMGYSARRGDVAVSVFRAELVQTNPKWGLGRRGVVEACKILNA